MSSRGAEDGEVLVIGQARQSGENELVIRTQDGKGAPRKLKVPGAGFYDELVFSPDSKRIVLTDNSLTLWVVDLASGASKVR